MIKITSRLQTPAPPRASRTSVAVVVPDEPPVSPEDVALTALLAAQVAAWEVEDTQRVLAIADGWIAEHGTEHRLYARAVTRRRGIESRWCIQQRLVWTACCQLWYALGLMTAREAWLADNAPEIDAGTLEALWGSFMGERLVPFGVVYPVADALPIPAWLHERTSVSGVSSSARRRRSGEGIVIMNFWRNQARTVCVRVREEWRALPDDQRTGAQLRSMLHDAYPFGERAMWPYKMWLEEQRIALAAEGYPSARHEAARVAKVAATGQLSLLPVLTAPVAVLERPETVSGGWDAAMRELSDWKRLSWADEDGAE